MAEGERAGVSDEQTAVARAVIYRFLSRCFSHPDRELIELIDSARLEEFLLSWRYLGSAASENVAKAVEWLAGRPSREDALLELQKEYTRLFITGYPQVVAPPYSSVYLGNQRTVWGQSTAEVAKLYEAAGLGMSEDFHDIPDHIAAELEFASYLIVEQQKDRENGSTPGEELCSLGQRFLEEHLFRWAPSFLKQILECSTAVFYRDIALTAREFLEWDAARY